MSAMNVVTQVTPRRPTPDPTTKSTKYSQTCISDHLYIKTTCLQWPCILSPMREKCVLQNLSRKATSLQWPLFLVSLGGSLQTGLTVIHHPQIAENRLVWDRFGVGQALLNVLRFKHCNGLTFPAFRRNCLHHGQFFRVG